MFVVIKFKNYFLVIVLFFLGISFQVTQTGNSMTSLLTSTNLNNLYFDLPFFKSFLEAFSNFNESEIHQTKNARKAFCLNLLGYDQAILEKLNSFLNTLESPEGQQLIKKNGLLPTRTLYGRQSIYKDLKEVINEMLTEESDNVKKIRTQIIQNLLNSQEQELLERTDTFKIFFSSIEYKAHCKYYNCTPGYYIKFYNHNFDIRYYGCKEEDLAKFSTYLKILLDQLSPKVFSFIVTFPYYLPTQQPPYHLLRDFVSLGNYNIGPISGEVKCCFPVIGAVKEDCKILLEMVNERIIELPLESCKLFQKFKEAANSSKEIEYFWDLTPPYSKNIKNLDLNNYDQSNIKRLEWFLSKMLRDDDQSKQIVLDHNVAVSKPKDNHCFDYEIFMLLTRVKIHLLKESSTLLETLEICLCDQNQTAEKSIEHFDLSNYNKTDLEKFEWFLSAITSPNKTLKRKIKKEFPIYNHNNRSLHVCILLREEIRLYLFFKDLNLANDPVWFKEFQAAATLHKSNLVNVRSCIEDFNLVDYDAFSLGQLEKFLKKIIFSKDEWEKKQSLNITHKCGIISYEQANNAYKNLLKRVEERIEEFKR